jgi:hypothetical protein
VKTHQQVVWRHWSVTKLASITFLSLAFSYWIDNLGFVTKGRLAVVLIIPSLGVPNWSVIYIINTAPSSNIPVSEFLVIDVVGLRSMYFVVMPRVSLIVILVMYVRYLYSINCPTVICLPSMLYLSYGETPLVNCRPRSNFLYIALLFYFTRTVYFTCILLSYYHSIRSFLCLQQTGEIDNLIVEGNMP